MIRTDELRQRTHAHVRLDAATGAAFNLERARRAVSEVQGDWEARRGGVGKGVVFPAVRHVCQLHREAMDIAESRLAD